MLGDEWLSLLAERLLFGGSAKTGLDSKVNELNSRAQKPRWSVMDGMVGGWWEIVEGRCRGGFLPGGSAFGRRGAKGTWSLAVTRES